MGAASELKFKNGYKLKLNLICREKRTNFDTLLYDHCKFANFHASTFILKMVGVCVLYASDMFYVQFSVFLFFVLLKLLGITL